MKKNIIIFGFILLAGGFILNFLAGATLPGNFTIPLVYGSNQTLWLFVSAVGLVIGILGFFLKKKKSAEKKEEKKEQ
jgi:LPXTG-motif cell wall-anchored protein